MYRNFDFIWFFVTVIILDYYNHSKIITIRDNDSLIKTNLNSDSFLIKNNNSNFSVFLIECQAKHDKSGLFTNNRLKQYFERKKLKNQKI